MSLGLRAEKPGFRKEAKADEFYWVLGILGFLFKGLA